MIISYKNGHTNLCLWTKTFLVLSCMALLKGLFDVVTILPDSSGWDVCKERLQKEGVAALRPIHFTQHFWSAFFELVQIELNGVPGLDGPLRYCADMMVSGHTYFAVVFSLSASDMMRWTVPLRFRIAVRMFCIFCVTIEVALVAAAKFHYTVDIFASVLMAALLWDSAHLETLASFWAEGYVFRPSNGWYNPTISMLAFIFPCFGRLSGDGQNKKEDAVPNHCWSRSRKVINLDHIRRRSTKEVGETCKGCEMCGLSSSVNPVDEQQQLLDRRAP